MEASEKKLQCVSYTAFQKDESPWKLENPDFKIPVERVEEDLKQIAQESECIRIYSITGLEFLPPLAEKYQLKILFGIWVNNDPIATDREISRAISIAKKYPHLIKAMIVGNETLLRKEMTSAQLITYIRKVKNNLPALDITYADVWEFWLKYPEVASAVDYITIHVLPYWEDDPVSIDQAIHHVKSIFEKVSTAFPDKKIFIGETGWPSRGRMREGSLPSEENQKKFIQEFLKLAEENHYHYNIIEAYNQPWKRYNEGTVGGYWGILHRPSEKISQLSDSIEKLGFPSRDPVETIIGTVFVFTSLLYTLFLIIKIFTKEKTHLIFNILKYLFYAQALFVTLGLVFDPRYREFPNLIFIIPTFLILYHILKNGQNRFERPIDTHWGWLFWVASIIILFQEGISNWQSDLWVAITIVLAFSLLPKNIPSPTFKIILISIFAYVGAALIRYSIMESSSVAQLCSDAMIHFQNPNMCQTRDFFGMLIHYKFFAKFALLLISIHFFIRGNFLPLIALACSVMGLVLYQVEWASVSFLIALTQCVKSKN
ncbi:MAG: hypothetical protein IPJ69_14195 [Deltaproteobacteria bacterium]|nr:MAG: hypothetical protein IPJ69_14195 [Deltaproteobacteria bacterium]